MNAELKRAIELARLDPGTPTPSPATDGLDTEGLLALFRNALLSMASVVEAAQAWRKTIADDDCGVPVAHDSDYPDDVLIRAIDALRAAPQETES